MFLVITADMKQSRDADNPHLSENITEINKIFSPIVPAELYAGDEIQILLKNQGGLKLMQNLFYLIRILQPKNFRFGIGIGQIQKPIKAKLAENSGDAFIKAREALDFAKKNDRLAWIHYDKISEYDNLNIALAFLSELTKRWSEKHWRRFFLYAQYGNVAKVAEFEKVSAEAINKFINTAGIRTILSVIPFTPPITKQPLSLNNENIN
jgi:hypothetical protein